MNKVCFIKDPHLMFGFTNNIRKPINGKSSGWTDSIIKKLNFIKDTMLENGVNILIFSGDVFDSSDSSEVKTNSNNLKTWSFNKYLKNKNILIDIFINSGIEIYSVQGNHDMFNGRAELKGTVFGDIVDQGVINLLTTNPLTFKTKVGLINIIGLDYSHTKEDQTKKFIEIKKDTSINMVVSHTNISPNEDQLVDFTYQELSTNFRNIDVHLCGHYHIGYPSTIVNNITFINPWNMTRVTREYQVKMDHHKPEMVLLDLDEYSNDNLNWVTHIELPHLPFEQAFNTEIVSVLKENEKFKFFEGDSEVNLDSLNDSDRPDEDLLSAIINSNLTDKTVNEKQRLLMKTIDYLK